MSDLAWVVWADVRSDEVSDSDVGVWVVSAVWVWVEDLAVGDVSVCSSEVSGGLLLSDCFVAEWAAFEYCGGVVFSGIGISSGYRWAEGSVGCGGTVSAHCVACVDGVHE